MNINGISNNFQNKKHSVNKYASVYGFLYIARKALVDTGWWMNSKNIRGISMRIFYYYQSIDLIDREAISSLH